MAHRAVPGIDRNGRSRSVTGPTPKIGKTATHEGVARDRSPSLVIRPDRVGGRCIIALRRSNSAHLHRPWRANLRKGLSQLWLLSHSLEILRGHPGDAECDRAQGPFT